MITYVKSLSKINKEKRVHLFKTSQRPMTSINIATEGPWRKGG